MGLMEATGKRKARGWRMSRIGGEAGNQEAGIRGEGFEVEWWTVERRSSDLECLLLTPVCTIYVLPGYRYLKS